MMINREFEDVYKYADEAYQLCIKKYLDNKILDDDIDEIMDKFVDIVDDICSDYIDYDDLALYILLDNIYDFAYDYSNICTDFTIIEVIENPRRYCNLYISDLVIEKISSVATEKLEYNIKDFFDKYHDFKDENTEKLYRKMFQDTFFS